MDKLSSPNTTPRKLKFEQLRADYELFLQTFEKPTWIYRKLRRNHLLSPFMLHRNLAYLRDPDKKVTEKQQTKRSAFKIDSLLDKAAATEAIAKIKKEDDSDSSHYMNLSFGGFFHGPGFAEDIFLTNDPKVQEIFKDDFVHIAIHLVLVYHKRKKDKQPVLDVLPLGECQAPWNPRTQLLLPCSSVQLSIPPTAFADNGRMIKSHIITITASIMVPKKTKKPKKKKSKKKSEGSSESDTETDCAGPVDIETVSPETASGKKARKYQKWDRKVRHSIGKYAIANGNAAALRYYKNEFPHLSESTVRYFRRKIQEEITKAAEEGGEQNISLTEPPLKRFKTDIADPLSEDSLQESPVEKVAATFSAELIVYDKHKNCLLTNGEYELLLVEDVKPSDQVKNSSWENKFKNKLGPFAAFSFGPTIKFRLSWDTKARVPIKPSYKSLIEPYVSSSTPLSNGVVHNGDMNGEVQSNGVDDTHKTVTPDKDKEVATDTAPPRVFYQFIYNNSTRQQTEAREGTSCPWCAVKTRRLYGLLKHLKCCHSRFAFLYTSLKNGHRIDVCVNDNFENSLSLDGIKDVGFVCVENLPLKREPYSEVLVARPYKFKQDLSEFAEPDNEEICGVTPMKGHDRVYYHSRNNQRMNSLSEYDPLAEDDRSPDWLLEKTQDMIEEFTDVNEGEKMLMKMWNIHVLKKGYIADFMVAIGCKTFAEEHGAEIIKNNLVRNFLVHLNNLIEFQVIPQSALVQAMEHLYKLKESMKISD